MNDLTTTVVTIAQMLAATAILLCGIEAVLTELQVKKLIQQRFISDEPVSKPSR